MILITNFNPWAEIPPASSGHFARRRVSLDADLTLYWFRDEMNHPGLLIEVPRTTSVLTLKEAKIDIRDISIDLRDMPDEGIRALILTLLEIRNLDVFLKLCLDLVERVTDARSHENSFEVICLRLKKWQTLLSGKAKNLLSQNEICGLYAELHFIAEMLTKDISFEILVIRGWKGPEKNQQDFILGDMAVEIKSLTGSQRGKVRVSSEDQLDSHLDKLYLRVYFLAEMQASNSGESLNAVVKRIVGMLKERESIALFESKLAAAHYIDIPDYDFPLFRVKDCRTYLVSASFPKIVRHTLPEGVEAVSYDIVLSSIDRFRTAVDILGE